MQCKIAKTATYLFLAGCLLAHCAPAGQTVVQTSIAKRNLAVLGSANSADADPMRPELRSTKALVKKENYFSIPQTQEASERLRVMNDKLEHRQQFQIDSQRDVLDYQKSNHQLALWYLRAVLRTQVRRLISDSRAQIRVEREHTSAKERAEKAATDKRLSMMGRAPASESRYSTDSAKSSDSTVDLDKVVADMGRFAEKLTNDGIFVEPVSNPMQFGSYFHLEPSNSTVSTRLYSALVNFYIDAHIFNREDPFPMIRGGGATGERLSLTSVRPFYVWGFDGAVSYNYLHRSLGCSVRKQISEWLSANFNQSWLGGSEPNSQVGLAISAIF